MRLLFVLLSSFFLKERLKGQRLMDGRGFAKWMNRYKVKTLLQKI